jgi:hypothetical protein
VIVAIITLLANPSIQIIQLFVAWGGDFGSSSLKGVSRLKGRPNPVKPTRKTRAIGIRNLDDPIRPRNVCRDRYPRAAKRIARVLQIILVAGLRIERNGRIAAAESEVVDDRLAILISTEIELAITRTRPILLMIHILKYRQSRVRCARAIQIVEHIQRKVPAR